MRWETVSSTSNNEVYHLYRDDKKILTIALNPFSNSARVECEKQKRVFLIRKEGFRSNNPMAELVLYKESIDHPFVTCGLSTKEGNPSVNFTKDKKLSDATHPGLLMALCWYMFLPVAKENVAEFA